MAGDNRVISIVEHEDEEIQWACTMSLYTDAGEPETLTEAMTRPNGHLWKMSAISEVRNFLSRKACILTKRSAVKPNSESLYMSSWYLIARKRLTE